VLWSCVSEKGGSGGEVRGEAAGEAEVRMGSEEEWRLRRFLTERLGHRSIHSWPREPSPQRTKKASSLKRLGSDEKRAREVGASTTERVRASWPQALVLAGHDSPPTELAELEFDRRCQGEERDREALRSFTTIRERPSSIHMPGSWLAAEPDLQEARAELQSEEDDLTEELNGLREKVSYSRCRGWRMSYNQMLAANHLHHL